MKNKLILGGVIGLTGLLLLKQLFVWAIVGLGVYGSFKYLTRSKK